MDSALTLLVFGTILLLIGTILVLAGLANLGRRRRILRTPTSSIAQAPGTGVIAIRGTIVPSADGVLTAPLSGGQVVWVRVTVEEYRQSWRSGHDWRTLAQEADSRPFLVDDGSGETARVLPRDANVIVPVHRLAPSDSVQDALSRLEAMLRARGRPTAGWLRSNRTLRYKEEVLSPGDAIRLFGPARREARSLARRGDAPSGSPGLVMAHGGSGASELLLTSETEERLVAKLLWKFVGGLAVSGVGLALVVVSVASGALESFD